MATASVTYPSFSPNTTIFSAQVNTDFQDLVTFLNGQVIFRDATAAFTAVPSGPATNPSSDNQLARKLYVDSHHGFCQIKATAVNISSASGVPHLVSAFSTTFNQPTGFFTPAANGVTINFNGWYAAILHVQFSSNSVNDRAGELNIGEPAATKLWEDTRNAGPGRATFTVTTCFLATATNKLHVRLGQNSGSTLTHTTELNVVPLWRT